MRQCKYSMELRLACRLFHQAALALFCALCLCASPAHAQSPANEYQVKAGLILSFLDFVEWPKDTFPRPDSPLLIGILGDDPFGDQVERTFSGKKAQGHPVEIRRSRNVEDLEKCQVIFVCHSERNHLSSILSQLVDKPILTIGEIHGFCDRGGILNFFVSDRRVHFEANPAAAQDSSLRVSAELLKRAKTPSSQRQRAQTP